MVRPTDCLPGHQYFPVTADRIWSQFFNKDFSFEKYLCIFGGFYNKHVCNWNVFYTHRLLWLPFRSDMMELQAPSLTFLHTTVRCDKWKSDIYGVPSCLELTSQATYFSNQPWA